MEIGKNITLPVCHVIGFPAAVITWSKEPDKLTHERVDMHDGQLSIINAQKVDSGWYQCKASNRMGFATAVTQLNVVELPRFTARPPSRLEVISGKNISVACSATGDPPPKIHWIKENGALPVGRFKVHEDGNLSVWNAVLEDSGRYICEASASGILRSSSTMDLNIKGKSAWPMRPLLSKARYSRNFCISVSLD